MSIPISELLKVAPLPPELAHFETIIRSPVGQNILDSIVGAYEAGLSESAMLDMLRQLARFHSGESHRCTTCLAWTDDPARSGGVIAHGRFTLIVTCKPCYRRILAGAATPRMVRNLQIYAGEVAK
jgi:hypothetical protein